MLRFSPSSVQEAAAVILCIRHAILRGMACLPLLAALLAPAASPADTPTAPAEPVVYTKRPLNAARLPEGAKPPAIDGDLSDAAWQHAPLASIFLDRQTSKPCPDQTEARLMYDGQYIYVAFHCRDSQPDKIIARETVRDAEMEDDGVIKDDHVELILDPFLSYQWDDQARFAVNPLGTQKTELGGGRASKLEWQGDWNASAKRVADGWTAEMRIPWAILSYPRSRGKMTMGVNFRRGQQRTQISSNWSDLGPQFRMEREGQWIGIEPPTQAWRPRMSFLPYLLPSGQASGGRSQFRVGLDARYQPTPELTGVATINPDFQSVEGAVEGINFSRSERFVPDRRPFFLEGEDYFEHGWGYQLGSYFNSNRIGQFDTGGKVYGKLTPKTTLGMLGTLDIGNEANFVTHLRRDFGATAGANVMLLQRLAPGQDNTVGVVSANARQGKWSVDGQFAGTAGPGAGGLGWTGAINLEDRNLFTTLRYRRVAHNFLNRLGFIPFVDYQGWSTFTDWSAQWRKGPFRGFNVNFGTTFDEHLDGRPFRRQAEFGVGFETRSDYRFGVNVGGGKFDNDADLVYGFNFGANVSNRFRQWGLMFQTGQQANKPYTAFGPSISMRLFRRLELNLTSFIQSFEGVSQQHILTFNYQMSPFRSWGGRVVIENSKFNFYISYRNAGRGGMDTYFILGDPNAERWTPRAMMKLVFAI